MQKEPTYHDLLEKMQIIISHSNELFYIHDTHHILSYVSPTSEKILGYSPEEMMVNWTDLATDNPLNQKRWQCVPGPFPLGSRHPRWQTCWVERCHHRHYRTEKNGTSLTGE